jgi:ABC-type multidrug transport system fused ATPase/permease subunit
LSQRYFRRSNRELQRLDAMSRSPLVAHVTESLQGAVTVRAFGLTDRFISRLQTLTDGNSQAMYNFQSASRWLGVRVESMSAVVMATVAAITWGMRSTVSASVTGFVLIWSLNFTISLQCVAALLRATGVPVSARVCGSSRVAGSLL